MLLSAVLLDAEIGAQHALQRLAPEADDRHVVIWRSTTATIEWWSFAVGELRRSLLAERTDMVTLAGALRLDEIQPDPVHQVSESSSAELWHSSGILLDGDACLGVLVPLTPDGNAIIDDPALLDTLGPGQPAAVPTPFTAYPRLDAPNSVQPGEMFDLVIGLSSRPAADIGFEERMEVELPPDVERFELVVQVIARGFTAPDGIRHRLHVDRDRYEQAKVVVRLVPDEIRDDVRVALLIVEYSYEGSLCGRAWREIRIVRPGVAAPHADTDQGASAVRTPAPEDAPDLTVRVEGGDRDGTLIWTFDAGRAVSEVDPSLDLPSHQVTSELGARTDARAFAEQVMSVIPERDGLTLIVDAMLGTGRQVSDAMPAEFWGLLGEVWARTRSQGRVPTLLLVSSDPHVPWELASVEDDWIDPTLLDSIRPPFLGAQVRMGRWIHPRPRSPHNVRWPLLPPSSQVEVENLAVVAEDYLAVSGERELPKAKEEGEHLRNRHGAVMLAGTLDEVMGLLRNELRVDGEPVAVEAIHFACHGNVFFDNPAYNGIVLAEPNIRLDETVIAGTRIGRATQPFVFVNACQLGTSTYQLGNYGGLAGAFLREGFRAFVAPLWNVDDQIAHDFAVTFYERTLNDRVPVAEVLRKLRGRFDVRAAGEPPASTWMAYVFYGHPNLILDRLT
jgi:CHAT domain/Ternary complex associated domain 7